MNIATKPSMLDSLKSLLSPILCWLRFPLVLYTSDTSGLYLAFAGHNRDRARTWAKRALGDDYREVATKKVWLWQCFQTSMELHEACAMLIVETSWVNEWFMRRHHGFKLSMWNQYTLDLSTPLSELERRSFRLRSDIPRHMRKHGLTYQISTDSADLPEYLSGMYKPFIAGRHEETAFLVGLEQLEEALSEGELLFVMCEGKRIAGVLISYANQMASIRYIGVLNNDPVHLKRGCIGAIYYFAMLRAIKRDQQWLNFGGASPFLNDGLTYFKLSFKPLVMANSFLEDHYVRLMILRQTPAFEQFFCRGNGFVHEPVAQRWNRAIFVTLDEINHPRLLTSRLKSLACAGIGETTFYVASEDDSRRALQAFLEDAELPAEFSQASIQLCDALLAR